MPTKIEAKSEEKKKQTIKKTTTKNDTTTSKKNTATSKTSPKKVSKASSTKTTKSNTTSKKTGTKKETTTKKKISTTDAKKNSSITKKASTTTKTTTKKKSTNTKGTVKKQTEEKKEVKETIKPEEKKIEAKEKTNDLKTKKNKVGNYIFFVLIIAVLLIAIFKSPLFINKYFKIKSISYFGNNENKPYIEIKLSNMIINKDLWCIASDSEKAPEFNDNWQLVKDNNCKIEINSDDKYIFIKNGKNISKPIKIEDYISCITKINVEDEEIKLIQDEEYELIPNIKIKYIGNPDKTLKFRSEDESIAKMEYGKIIGVNDGITNIVIEDNYNNISKVKVQVTTLINLPKINNSRPFLKYKQYTEEEAKILDEYLFYQVEKAGKGTRAGAVAAARFLTLEFKYRIPYFLENGRLSTRNRSGQYADGEGRYYHEGLYLSESKYSSIEKRVAGPMMWGGRIMEYSTDNGSIPNGLDCSGFVTWCLKNGGCDFGDIGAGPNEAWTTLPDKGISQRITMDLLNSHKVKAGDLIGKDGHIAIIIGITDEKIYVADTLLYSRGTWVTEFTYQGLVNSYSFTHIYDMSNAYESDGNYTNMW